MPDKEDIFNSKAVSTSISSDPMHFPEDYQGCLLSYLSGEFNTLLLMLRGLEYHTPGEHPATEATMPVSKEIMKLTGESKA
jgi:hypothetical protein